MTFGVGFALFAALPWVMIQKGHIKIDIFEPVFNRTANRVLDLIGDISLAAIAYLIMARQWYLIFSKARKSQDSLFDLVIRGDFASVFDRIRTSQESQILGLPLWPTYIVAEICVIVFFLVACFCVLRGGRVLLSSPKAGT